MQQVCFQQVCVPAIVHRSRNHSILQVQQAAQAQEPGFRARPRRRRLAFFRGSRARAARARPLMRPQIASHLGVRGDGRAASQSGAIHRRVHGIVERVVSKVAAASAPRFYSKKLATLNYIKLTQNYYKLTDVIVWSPLQLIHIIQK